MIKQWFRFYSWLVILSLVLISVNYFAAEVFFSMPFGAVHYGMHTYYIALVLIAQVILARALKDRPQRFVVVFMAVMGFKMFLSLGVIVIAAYTGLVQSKFIIINFLLLYLSYSAFSVQQILTFQKVFVRQQDKDAPAP